MKLRTLKSNDLSILNGHEADGIRQLRKPLLEAFDVYKSNIVYGIETETEEERLVIIEWYQKLLDKDKTAINNIPAKILRYIK